MSAAPKTFVVKLCGEDEWLGCEPGWYWGELFEAEAGEVTLGDSVGPFDTAGAAAMSMTRTMVGADAGLY